MSAQHYAYDGMYINVDKIETDYEYQAKLEKSIRRKVKERRCNYFFEHINGRFETYLERAIRFQFKLENSLSNQEVRNIFINELLMRNIDSIWTEYSEKNFLESYYKFISISTNGMVELIIDFMDSSEIEFRDDFFYNELPNLFVSLYSSHETTYERVNRLQKLIHNEMLVSNGSTALRPSKRRKMRRLLSVARFHLMYVDLNKNGIEKIINEYRLYSGMRFENEKEIEKNLFYNYKPWIESESKVYVENWRKKHFRTLIDYLPKDINFTKKIVGLDLSLGKSRYIEQCYDIAFNFGQDFNSAHAGLAAPKKQIQESAFMYLINKL